MCWIAMVLLKWSNITNTIKEREKVTMEKIIMTYEEAEKYLEEAFEQNVPQMGKSDTLYGELVRATNRIGYRFFNDGDMIGTGYGNETCNPAARFIDKNINEEEITKLLNDMWGMSSEDAYEALLRLFVIKMAEYLKGNKETLLAKETADMWDSRDPYEDVDRPDDEDEYCCGYSW